MSFETLFSALLVSDTPGFSLPQLALSMLVPFILVFPMSAVYRRTQQSGGQGLEFIQALFLFCVLSSVVTLIIGNNVARAFGLIGALSIVRFRNALKSPVDTVYIFWALTVGMACGTGNFLAGATIVTGCCTLMWLLDFIQYGEGSTLDTIVRIEATAENEKTTLKNIEKILDKQAIRYRCINVIQSTNRPQKTYVYLVRQKRKVDSSLFQKMLASVEGVVGVDHSQNENPVFLVG